MARTHGPLFSLQASGTVGGTIVYSTWKGRPYVREHVVPHNPRNPLQVAIRAWFAWCVAFFKVSSLSIQADWPAFALASKLTLLNAFVGVNQKRARQGLSPLYQLHPLLSPTCDPVTTFVVQGGKGQVSCSWVDPTTPLFLAVAVMASASTLANYDFTKVVSVKPSNILTAAALHVPPGSYYIYGAAAVENGPWSALTPCQAPVVVT